MPSAAISANDDGDVVVQLRPLRACRGVPSTLPGAYGAGQGPALECDSKVTSGVCDSCAAEIERRTLAVDEANEAAALRKRLEVAGLPLPYVTGTKSLETFRSLTPTHERALDAVRELITGRTSAGVLLRGDAGIGKTHLMQGAAREAILAGRRARYVNCRDLALKLQGSFRDDAKESTESILNALTHPNGPGHFLMLDDLGATKTTRFVSDSFYSLLDRRAQNELPTIVSTNYVTMAALAERLLPSDGDEFDAIRPIDRLEELCPRVFTLRGESQRAKVNR